MKVVDGRKFSVSLSREELLEEFKDLNSDEDVLFFLRLEKGRRKFAKLLKLGKILEVEDVKKE